MSVQTFKFKSRSEDTEHTVTVGANGHLHCTCRGFKTPSRCWHVRDVADQLGLPQSSRSNTKSLALPLEESVASDQSPAPPKAWASHEEQRAFKVAKDMLVNGTSTEVPRGITRFTPHPGCVEPMLGRALKEGESIDQYTGRAGWTLEEKYDGHRVIVFVDEKRIPRMWSRDNNPRDISRHLVNALQYLAPGLYDGELFIPGKSSTDVTRRDLLHKHRLVLFDVLFVYNPDDGEYHGCMHYSLRSRREHLTVAMSRIVHGEVFQAPWRDAHPIHLNEIWSRGGEGVMLKLDTEAYAPGRRQWIKFKKEEIGRGKITGFKAGKLGPCAIVCARDEHGIDVQCKARDTRMRHAFEANPNSFINKTLVFSYQQKTADGRYRHPMADHIEE